MADTFTAPVPELVPENYRGRTAVVTGGAGFIGQRMCRRLLNMGWAVYCVDDLSTGRSGNPAELGAYEAYRFLRHDMSLRCPAVGDVDLVVHLACPPSPAYYLAHPIRTLRCASEATLNALELARASQARFLLASTSEIYGDPLCHPQDETYHGNVNPVGPRSVYDEGKRYAEALTAAYRREYGTDTCIARIFNTYGPGMRTDDGRMIPTFIEQALNGHPLTVFGDGSQTRSLCYVDDTVDGLLELARSAEHEPINIGNPEERTVDEVAAAVARAVGNAEAVEHLPAQADDPVRRRPDITRARTRLNWSPRVSFSEGLCRTVDWFRRSAVPAVAGHQQEGVT